MTTTTTPQPTKVFKILTAPQWADWQRKTSFTGAAIDLDDGYIHLSTLEQAVETHDKFFAGQEDLVLVLVDLEKVTDPIKWEPSRHGQLFPHVYGSIGLKAVAGKVEGWSGQKPDVEGMLGVGRSSLPDVDIDAARVQETLSKA